MMSNSYKILNAEPLNYSAEANALLKRLGTVVAKEMSRAQLIHELREYDVLIVRLAHQVDREIMEAAPNLKVIVTATTGLDHIDLEHARARGITVLSLQGETDFLRTVSATAEHTWALLLGLLRLLVLASEAGASGNWDRDAFRGHELYGKRLGLIGLGRIGVMVARYGRAFSMEVGAFDPFISEWTEDVWQAPALSDLLKRSDVLSLHVPLNAQTKGMIGFQEIKLLPPGAVLINTSRGQLIDEAALLQALEGGWLAGAALDVVADERNADQRIDSPLLNYARKSKNLLITPHIGGATYESMAKTEVFMANKLVKFLDATEKEQ